MRDIGWALAKLDPDVWGDPLRREQRALAKLQRSKLEEEGAQAVVLVPSNSVFVGGAKVDAADIRRACPGLTDEEAAEVVENADG